MSLEAIYERRFAPDVQFRQDMWRILCQDFFQRYVPPTSHVVEIGAGYCEFINHIVAARKVAVDLNTDTSRYANADVEVVTTSSTDLSAIPSSSLDVAFASNFFEHLARGDIVLTMREVARILRPGGRFLILQPNYRYCYRDYWMFFDHVTALDHHSLEEALETTGFRTVEMLPRFLPYTTKSSLPKSPLLVKAYLRLPLIWRLLGQQAFAVAEVAPGGILP
ncbi:MAG TPA: class I SAM-dependent methyltransferase [Chloroflexota bacterium]